MYVHWKASEVLHLFGQVIQEVCHNGQNLGVQHQPCRVYEVFIYPRWCRISSINSGKLPWNTEYINHLHMMDLPANQQVILRLLEGSAETIFCSPADPLRIVNLSSPPINHWWNCFFSEQITYRELEQLTKMETTNRGGNIHEITSLNYLFGATSPDITRICVE